jgi:hypothetical protein
MKCPKCGLNSSQEDVCSDCGVIFAKYRELQNRKKNTSLKLKKHSDTETLTEKPTQFWKPITTGQFIGMSLLFSGLFFLLFLHGAMGKGIFLFLLHNVNLVFHEAGHFILMLLNFGRIPVILGGSLGQLAIPLIVCIAFFRERDRAGFAFAGVWFFENFLDIAVYMADSRALVLPLIGGLGEESHDWRNLFLHWGVLEQDLKIAENIEAMGWAGMALFWFWLGWSWTLTKGGETNPPPKAYK